MIPRALILRSFSLPCTSSKSFTMVNLDDIRAASHRITPISAPTPLVRYNAGSGAGSGNSGTADSRSLFLKLENQQPMGAFKLRGAYNKLCLLSPQQRLAGVVAYSSGNHAQGVAYAARALGIRAIIVMPENAPPIKRNATAAMGAEIIAVGGSSEERRQLAEKLAVEHGYILVPPYNDEQIIAGAGTVGLEIMEQLPEVETIFVPVGGGGLLSGVAVAAKQRAAELGCTIHVIGVEPELAADAQASFRTNSIVKLTGEQSSRTLADGLRTQSIGDLAFPLIRQYVDDIITVTEEEIREAVRLLAVNPATLPEPSGAVAAAGYFFRAHQLPESRWNVAVISGGNVEPALLAEILAG